MSKKTELVKLREIIDKHIDSLLKELNKDKEKKEQVDKLYVIKLLKLYIDTYEKVHK